MGHYVTLIRYKTDAGHFNFSPVKSEKTASVLRRSDARSEAPSRPPRGEENETVNVLATLTSVRRKVYAELTLKILGIITGNNARPRVGTLGLSVRVTMKTSNGCHAKRQRLCVYDITRTLRPSVPTGWVATWLMAKCRFIGIYGTKIEKSCTSLIPNSRYFTT